jgi:hypothetical protein
MPASYFSRGVQLSRNVLLQRGFRISVARDLFLHQGINYSAVYLNTFLPVHDRGTLIQDVRIGEVAFDLTREAVSRRYDVSIALNL